MRLFALDATREFGERMAAALGVDLDAHEERVFEDGEHKARPLVSVRDRDCYVVQSLHAGPDDPASEKLVRLLFFAATLRDHGARRVTAVIPYMAYARKDRRTKPRDPVTSRYAAQLIEAAGIDAVVTLETHNVAAWDNAFRIPAVHLVPHDLFTEPARAFAGDAPLAVVSPDPGGVKRAQLFREHLEAKLGREIGSAWLEKRRSAGVVSGSQLAGDVAGAAAILIDDIVSTGGTMVRAAETLKEAGATRVAAFAAHGLFIDGARPLFESPHIERVAVTDTVPLFRLDAAAAERVETIPAAPLFADAVRRLHAGGSISELLAR
jgi:ribose-phosphate pyrophosphokinase